MPSAEWKNALTGLALAPILPRMSADPVQNPVQNPTESRERARWVAPLAWSSVALEGFDLVVLGVVLPPMLDDGVWGLTPVTASLITSAGLVGVMIGAIVIGTVTDIIGRRRTMLFTVIGFSVLTLLCAVAPDPWTFGMLRVLAGLGLGGVLPVAIALVNEHAHVGKGSSATTVLMTGYHVGAVLTALLGIVVIPALGWRAMFVIGALPALVLVPLIIRFLPESEAFLREKSGERHNPVSILFSGGYLRATIAFWVSSFMGLLLVYGLNTWLPRIMQTAGYELGAALALLLVLNVGAILGLLVAGQVANRVGTRPAVLAWFTAAALFLAVLSIRLPGIGVYIGVLLAGVFVFSAQVLVYAYVSQLYPAAARGTAIGAASGVGRLGAILGPMIGGVLLSAGIAYPWGFYVFAVVAAIGAVAVAAVGVSGAAKATA
jgi:MFS transporter, AAHS family, benzoate transport protein